MAGSRALLLSLAVALLAAGAGAATISGTVRAAQGSTLASMTVAGYDAAGSLRGTAITDAQGRYHLTIAAGTYRLLAYDAAGVYATDFYGGAESFDVTEFVELSATQSLAGVDFTLHRAGHLSGVVTGDSAPQAGAVVTAYNLSGTRRGFTRADSTGSYTLALPPGEFRVAAWDETGVFGVSFYDGVQEFGHAALVPLLSGSSRRIDFALSRLAIVFGQTLDAVTRAPLPNITVEAWDHRGVRTRSVVSNASGFFTISLPAGDYRLLAFDPTGTYATAFRSDAEGFEATPLLTISAGQTLPGVEFLLPKGVRVTGTVRAQSSGAAIEGVTVAAFNPSGIRRQFTLTDASGGYALVLPAGSYRLAAYDTALQFATLFHPSAPTFATAVAMTVAEQQPPTAADFQLLRMARVEGRITTSGGLPLAGMYVAAYREDGVLLASTTSLGNGLYTLHLPPAAVKVAASDPGGRFSTRYSGNGASFETAQILSPGEGESVREDLQLPAAGQIPARRHPAPGVAPAAGSQ